MDKDVDKEGIRGSGYAGYGRMDEECTWVLIRMWREKWEQRKRYSMKKDMRDWQGE